MKKKYIYIIIIFIASFFSSSLSAQENRGSSIGKIQDNTIEGLSIYPNPVSGDKIYITSKNNLEKEVEIFDVLGKRVLFSSINSRELYIGTISSGVYIIKIKEGDATASRKLIIR